MKCITRILTIATLVLAASFSAAQPVAGNSEFEGSGQIFAQENSTNYSVFGSYGYYFSDSWKAEIDLGFLGTSIDEETNSSGSTPEDTAPALGSKGTTLLVGVGLQYLFNTTGDTPYITGSLTSFTPEEGDSSSTADAYLGYRTYKGDNLAINYEVGYQFYLDSKSKDSGQIAVKFGLAFYF